MVVLIDNFIELIDNCKDYIEDIHLTYIDSYIYNKNIIYY